MDYNIYDLSEEELINAKSYFPVFKDESKQKNFSDDVFIKNYIKQKIFNYYYKDNSFDIANEKSKKEREEKKLSKYFIYGEATYNCISYILEYINLYFGIIPGNFYDLGSGAGKALISAAINHPFDKCIGVELLSSLYNMAESTKSLFNDNIQNQMNQYKSCFNNFKHIPIIENIQDDLMNIDIINPSVILVCATMFDEKYMNTLGNKLEKVAQKGTCIITITERFDLFDKNEWDVFKPEKVKFTWGYPTLYIYRKKV